MNHDNSTHLIKMANQIGQFFEANGATGTQNALEHIQKFWAPAMREEMKQLIKTNQAQDLSVFMQNALQNLA